MAEFEALSTRIAGGERQLIPQALETFEGYMRLQYVPTLHMYQAWGMEDPRIAGALKTIDETVAKAVAAVAESFGEMGG